MSTTWLEFFINLGEIGGNNLSRVFFSYLFYFVSFSSGSERTDGLYKDWRVLCDFAKYNLLLLLFFCSLDNLKNILFIYIALVCWGGSGFLSRA